MSEASILVVEDEEDLAHILVDYLKLAGFAAAACHDGRLAREHVATVCPDLVLLDLMLPGTDGLTLLRDWRADPQRAQMPVILVTARVEEVDRLIGLESGADDYICKPFSPREVVAWVKTLLRRSAWHPVAPETGLVIDAAAWQASWNGHRLDLTPKEFELLRQLAAPSPARVASTAPPTALPAPSPAPIAWTAAKSGITNTASKACCAPAR